MVMQGDRHEVTLQSTLACIDTCTQQQERDGEEQINAHPLLYLKLTHTPIPPTSHISLSSTSTSPTATPLQQNATINSVTLLFAVGTTANTRGDLTMCCIQEHKKQLRIPFTPYLFTQSDYSTHHSSKDQHGLWRCGRGGSSTPFIVHELMHVCVCVCVC